MSKTVAKTIALSLCGVIILFLTMVPYHRTMVVTSWGTPYGYCNCSTVKLIEGCDSECVEHLIKVETAPFALEVGDTVTVYKTPFQMTWHISERRPRYIAPQKDYSSVIQERLLNLHYQYKTNPWGF